MSEDRNPDFEVTLTDDGGVKITGEWAVRMLLRIVLNAKFQTELSAEMLLSPHLNKLITELTLASPILPTDWTSPDVMTPPAFTEAVDVIREFRDLHQPDSTLEDLVRKALHPHSVPMSRLGISG